MGVRPGELERPQVDVPAEPIGGAAVPELVVLGIPEIIAPLDRISVFIGDVEAKVRIGERRSEVRVIERRAGSPELSASEPGGPDVEKEEAPEIAQEPDGEGDGVDQGKTELDVEERDVAAEELTEIVSRQLVQASKGVDAVALPVAEQADQTQGQKGARRGAAVQAVVDGGVDERAGREQGGIAAGAHGGGPVLAYLEALAMVRAELLEAGGVAAPAP